MSSDTTSKPRRVHIELSYNDYAIRFGTNPKIVLSDTYYLFEASSWKGRAINYGGIAFVALVVIKMIF